MPFQRPNLANDQMRRCRPTLRARRLSPVAGRSRFGGHFRNPGTGPLLRRETRWLQEAEITRQWTGMAENPLHLPALGETQRRIVEILDNRPGTSIRYLGRCLGIKHASATYAVKQLRKKKVVQQHKDGRIARNYLAEDIRRDRSTLLMPLLRDARSRKIMHLLHKPSSGSQWTINRLATQSTATHAFTMRTLEFMASHGFVDLEVRPDCRVARPHSEFAAILKKLETSQSNLETPVAIRQPATRPDEASSDGSMEAQLGAGCH